MPLAIAIVFSGWPLQFGPNPPTVSPKSGCYSPLCNPAHLGANQHFRPGRSIQPAVIPTSAPTGGDTRGMARKLATCLILFGAIVHSGMAQGSRTVLDGVYT